MASIFDKLIAAYKRNPSKKMQDHSESDAITVKQNLAEWYQRGQQDMYKRNDPKTSPNHRYRSTRANASPEYFTGREDPNKGGDAIRKRKQRESEN